MRITFIFILIFALGQLFLTSCSHNAVHQPHSTRISTEHEKENYSGTKGHEIAHLAKLQLGKPYRYGGASPSGFDCSGLVYYTHNYLGIQTPRTSKQQFSAAKPIDTNQLQQGDVIFFKLASRNVSHVGIYVGEGQFIHAPKAGKHVSKTFLNDPYWKTHLVGGGRFY